MRDIIRFVRRGRLVELADIRPTETLLDYLRLREGAYGTKEGCNEGDCGACTVALGRLEGGRIRYEPVNACILFLGMIDGTEIVTVEDLAEGERLHPVQQAMVDHHGAQCGFCTPGIVMSLFTHFHDGSAGADRAEINDRLAGNLCRCTGYRPIAAAAAAALAGPRTDRFDETEYDRAGLLSYIHDGQDIFVGGEDAFFAAPRSIDGLAALYARHPDATLVAGATDVGLWVTKQLRDLPKIIHLGRVEGLDTVEDHGRALIVGATATYARTRDAVAAIDPDLGELWRRLGSAQVRASGTVGGNIANGSPIGDTPPALIALGASLELLHGETSRTLALEDYFLAYGKQDRNAGEFVAGVLIPKLADDQVFRCYKIAKRFDQDIASVMGAFLFTLDGGVITHARIAFGGMAATPKRARNAEERIVGVEPARASSWSAAIEALGEDFAPLSDHRASAGYRLETARSLLAKALVEAAGVPTGVTRLTGQREALHAAQ